MGGAYVDLSNAYLQGSHFDMTPQQGKLVIFPAFLKHQAMPYEGRKDRAVLSFKIQVHGERGDRALDSASPETRLGGARRAAAGDMVDRVRARHGGRG